MKIIDKNVTSAAVKLAQLLDKHRIFKKHIYDNTFSF